MMKKIFSKFKIILLFSFFLIIAVLMIFSSQSGNVQQIKAEGEPVSVCRDPIDVVFVIDRSGTMLPEGTKFLKTKDASKNFIDKLISNPPETFFHQVGLVAFNNTVDGWELIVVKEETETEKNAIKEAIDELSNPNSHREITEALLMAKNKLENAEPSSGKKKMIILTGGSPKSLADASSQVDSIKGKDIRIIAIGLGLDKLLGSDEINAKAFIKYASSSPTDCYYLTDDTENTEDTLIDCQLKNNKDLSIILEDAYNNITDAICDESPPTIEISRTPIRTLFKGDTLKITSKATDDVGFKSHTLIWDNLNDSNPTTEKPCSISADSEIICSSGDIGSFNTGDKIEYKSKAVDANDHSVETEIKSVTVADVSLTVPALKRNTDNEIKVKIRDYKNEPIFVSILSPSDVSGEVIKKPMNCNKINPAVCTYNFDTADHTTLDYDGCSNWSNGTTSPVGDKNSYSNDINLDIKIYVKRDEIYTEIASETNQLLISGLENSDSTCGDSKNNDCDFDEFGNGIIDLAELSCDSEIPTVIIEHSPGIVNETTTITFTSTATDNWGIKEHTVYYKVGSDNYSSYTFPNTLPADSTLTWNIGPFPSKIGKTVTYYSEATDFNNNTNESGTETFVIKNKECEGIINLGSCNSSDGVCCNGICDTSLDEGDLDSDCSVEDCVGFEWKLVPINNEKLCSTNSGDEAGCYSFTPSQAITPNNIPSFYNPANPYNSNGCEMQVYKCFDGSCNYTVKDNDRRIDSCDPFANPIVFKDFECDYTVLPKGECKKKHEWEDTKCDNTISFSDLTVTDNQPFGNIVGKPEILENRTNKITMTAHVTDPQGIASHKLFWQVNGGSWQEKDCGSCSSWEENCHNLIGGVEPTSEEIIECYNKPGNGGFCNCSQEIGQFNHGDFINYYMWVQDGSSNKNEKYIGEIPAPNSEDFVPYSLAVRDNECYEIPSDYSVDGVSKTDITSCDSGNGICCGGYCDSNPDATSYDEECRVNSCSGVNWVYAISNTNAVPETKEGNSCGSTDTCFDYYSPNNSFYGGCITGGNECSSGICEILSTVTSYPTCNGNLLTDYSCTNHATGFCEEDSGDIDCSSNSTNYDSDEVACNCDCNHYDIEEKVYSSLSFDGVDDYVNIPNDLGDPDEMSLEFWFYVSIGDKTRTQYFMDGRNGGNWWFLQSYNPNGSGNINFNNKVKIENSDWTAGQWNHLILVINSINSKIYMNGDFKSMGTGLNPDLGSNMRIGTRFTNNNYFRGKIDEVRIYNRALYPEEVEHHYEGIFADDTGLVGYWNFDEKTGEIAKDSSGNNNDGTLMNNPQWMKYYHNSASGLDGNVPPNWQVCTDGKDNDCDGVADDYNDTIGVSNCDGEVDEFVPAATTMKDGESPSITDLITLSTINDLDIDTLDNDLTLSITATDDFSILQTRIEWTVDDWSEAEEIKSKTCDSSGVCEVCIKGGSCENDSIDPDLLIGGNTFKFRFSAVDNSINNNERYSNEYSISIGSSNDVPIITPLEVGVHNYCLDGLRYVLGWSWSDINNQGSYKIQIATDSSFTLTDRVIDKSFSLASHFYQVASEDFIVGKEIEYGEIKYYWRVKVKDDKAGYEQETEWKEGPSFITPKYEYPQIEFSVIPEHSNPCFLSSGFSCDYGEDLTFKDESTFFQCRDNTGCLNTNFSECDTINNVCISCTSDDGCSHLKHGSVNYSCSSSSKKCEVSGNCNNDNKCKATDLARCDSGDCSPCLEDSHCEEFSKENVENGSLGNASSVSGKKLTDSDQLWEVDEWIGGYVKIDGKEKKIVSNTETTLTVGSSFGTVSTLNYKIMKYYCSKEGICEDKERRKWWFYSDNDKVPDSREINPVNNYIESVVDFYDVILEVRDNDGNSCSLKKAISLGGKKFPKWNEISPFN